MYSLSLAEVEVQTRSTSLSVTVELDYKFNSFSSPLSNASSAALTHPTVAAAAAVSAGGTEGGPEAVAGMAANTAANRASAAEAPPVALPEVNLSQDPPSSASSAAGAVDAMSGLPTEMSSTDRSPDAAIGNIVQVMLREEGTNTFCYLQIICSELSITATE